jgi:hypothetical protein
MGSMISYGPSFVPGSMPRRFSVQPLDLSNSGRRSQQR